LILAPTREDLTTEYFWVFPEQVPVEDIEICQAVQRNFHSRSYQRGRYSVKQEKGVHAFHRMYAEVMQG
jgi:choline monooxygenase